MTEASSSFKDGEVVWVKWGSSWWPGEVHDASRVPEDMTAALRKQPIAFVKFLQEDSYELVRNNNSIMKYNSDKKMENIKKGIEKYRSNEKMKENFSECIVIAERLTGGNVNILKTLDTPVKSKAPPTPDSSKKLPQTPLASTSSLASAKKSLTTPSSYNSSVKVQNTTSTEQSRTNDKRFTCTMCSFSTDRMNLLMMHIKGHSQEIQSRVSGGSSISRPIIPKTTAARKLEIDDGIAEDVRKIKESMKEQNKSSPTPTSSGRKSRTPAVAKVAEKTPKPPAKPRAKRTTRAVKEQSPEEQEQETSSQDEEKPKVNEELKNELLADWLDDDDIVEKEKIESPKAPIVEEEKPKPAEKSSVPIRNIPKKQRVSEIYIQPEVAPLAVSPPKEEEIKNETPIESSKKSQTSQRSGKRKLNTKPEVDEDEKLLMATAELLNEIEVPAKSVEEPTTTFQKSNDIDKRNLPPKERNKRFLRATKSPEMSPATQIEAPVKSEEPTPTETLQVVTVNKNDRQELMLPHKKKQSSRLLQTSVTEAIKTSPVSEVLGGRKKKRKSSSEVNESEEQKAVVDVLPSQQSPLRESAKSSEEPSVESTIHNRGQKRHLSNDNSVLDDNDQVQQPELKKFHRSSPFSEQREQRTITCGANEAICITSRGTLTVARRDSLKTTQANSVVVTSQVIITEPIATPEVVTTTTAKPSSVVSLSQQTLKNALKIPKENMEEFKKQGLLTIENNRTKLTPKGLQIFKEYQKSDEKTATNNNLPIVSTSEASESLNESSTKETIVEEDEKSSQEEAMDVSDSKEQQSDSSQKIDELKEEEESLKHESDQNGGSEEQQATPMEIDDEESPKESNVKLDEVDEKKESIEEPKELESQKKSDDTDAAAEESTKEDDVKPVENGSKDDDLDTPNEDANTSSGAGLIALQAENFGGPANCFYLCRQIDDRYEPVDNQILVLNAQNALVPYEGDISDLTPSENPSGSQLSPNSNIIISTPNGQKVELNYFAILALQESADENGVASMEYAGEQFEMNVNAILEAIAAQQDNEGGEAIVDGTIEGGNALILTESSDLPVDIKHSATQVSETLSKPIMSTTIAPEIATATTPIAEKNLNIDDSLAAIGVTQTSRANVPKSLELPITVTNPTIAETVNHRKLAASTAVISNSSDAVASESFVVDNGSDE